MVRMSTFILIFMAFSLWRLIWSTLRLPQQARNVLAHKVIHQINPRTRFSLSLGAGAVKRKRARHR